MWWETKRLGDRDHTPLAIFGIMRRIGIVTREHTSVRTLAGPIIQNQVFGPQWEAGSA